MSDKKLKDIRLTEAMKPMRTTSFSGPTDTKGHKPKPPKGPLPNPAAFFKPAAAQATPASSNSDSSSKD